MFQREILQLIAANPSLKVYLLTDKQWDLAKHLSDVLIVRLLVVTKKNAHK